ncbi:MULTISPECIES: SDR family NAD(P)-dependent oxidoreductase [unclassified Parafrankia]|uniref:SDR family NAD(P)-dependent oxidoreductase n=1 Tax=unclassified Parafrankia TaxID=2994368 RepID=UPI000DA4D03E|nr:MULTISPECIES: SDR family NAD(P)-dependent oxidoreductase [unclassified Parafrankia]TCJ36498.1 SDR family NAD(P)-dependent oxidoreductase [Parafrankia sp. BMG5.11]SQD97626.1 Short-chain dehydrogenase/reductase SDR [Parafrankia sp. Ea1.12]
MRPGARDAGWSLADVPDQRGRTAVVTGANSGIGFEAAKVLAERGATVILACREPARAEQAAARIRTAAPRADVHVEPLDLISMTSVRAAAERIRAAHPRLDLLVNNAGVMLPPPGPSGDGLGGDGIEPTFGVNHLGHFALTGLLLDRILATPHSRIVTVSSLAHLVGRLDLEQLRRLPPRADRPGDIRPVVVPDQRAGSPSEPLSASPSGPRAPARGERDSAALDSAVRDGGRPAHQRLRRSPGMPGMGRRLPRQRLPYPTSKLANLMFTFELQRRLAATGASTIAVAAHPGIARTGLTRNLMPPARVFMGLRLAPLMSWLVQDPEIGALATVRAALDPAARAGDYYGPAGLFHSTGLPVAVRSSARSRDTHLQHRLWVESERLTGVSYDFHRSLERPSPSRA